MTAPIASPGTLTPTVMDTVIRRISSKTAQAQQPCKDVSPTATTATTATAASTQEQNAPMIKDVEAALIATATVNLKILCSHGTQIAMEISTVTPTLPSNPAARQADTSMSQVIVMITTHQNGLEQDARTMETAQAI